ncbi:MAG TPA: hypothetical protein DDW96_02625 [Synergistaceae bacterium]|nr:hypothetical protein [Synergistaceae bacterium]HCP08030.1 hypothetical protein [Synergistaceae bacterium]
MISVELTDPGAFRLETRPGSWFVSAANSRRLKAELEKPSFLSLEEKEQVRRLGGLCDNGAILYVPCHGRLMWLYRTINATRELYLRCDAEGQWHFGDHFRNMLADIPCRERSLDEHALLDHLLFRFPLGISTRVKGIRRLTPGEILCIDTSTREKLSRQAERSPCEPFELGIEEAVSALEENLRSAFDGSGTDDCLLFSGGVDSTLMQSFRPGGSKTLTMTIDSPEIAFETEYARTAAHLLETDLLIVPLDEDGYRTLSEETIANLGQPIIPGFQPVFLYRAFQAPFRLFWVGDVADTLLGHPQTRRIMNPDERPQFRNELTEPFDSPQGYGALSNTSPDIKVIRRLFGERAVSARIEARLSLVLERARIRPGKRLEEHAQLTSLVEFFCSANEAVCSKRQTAALFGREIGDPFFSRGLLGLATAIPAGIRFFHGGEAKPVPKALLRKRLPEYSFYGKKGGSDIPRTRFCLSGPFREFFQDSAFPDNMPPGGKELLLDPQKDWSYLTLSAAIFSTWQERVLKAERLEKVPCTRLFRLEQKRDYHTGGKRY